ncbi:MAG TPA: glycosyltransferase family 4 protein [Ignavibacteria bacterium]|nr:glycosyltransferase family 4 protein [Ignavibacteria bacterium]HMR39844.1 glycosyltransferase family 4 protein [Ignavibacteria bacterium]
MTVIEISECFPNKLKPVTGEFIYNHVKALSELCEVVTLVPVRYIPPKEILSYNPAKFISNLTGWFSSINDTNTFTEGDLKVIYFGYVSLPRPYFEKADNDFINFFFYKKALRLIDGIKPDVICCNWIRPWAELSKKLADHFKVPLVIDHHEDIPTLKKLFPKDHKTFLRTFKKADKIIVHSTVNKRELEDEDPDLKDISICYLGQSLDILDSPKNFSPDKNKLICVSHLSERRKNIDTLIGALACLKEKYEKDNFELTIAGDGILKNEYAELSEKLKLKNIVFEGEVSQAKVSELLTGADIFILPSYPEAFGVVIIEALAKGLPVITCEGNGGGEELKKLGYPVILVKSGSPDEMAKAISELSQNESLMKEMSLKGIEIVSKHFTWEYNAENTYQLLIDTIKKFKTFDS